MVWRCEGPERAIARIIDNCPATLNRDPHIVSGFKSIECGRNRWIADPLLPIRGIGQQYELKDDQISKRGVHS